MAAATYTYVTVLDEIRLALDWKGTDKIMSDAEINRFIFEHIMAEESTWVFQKVTTGLYKNYHGYSYGLMLYNPTFTGEDDCVYLVNARGSISVTTGTHSTETINVTGARVDFPTVMVDILHWLATHRCKEISESVGGGSVSSTSVAREIRDMIEYWQGVTVLK